MDRTAFNAAYENLYSAFVRHGLKKEAAELEARGFNFPSTKTPLAPPPPAPKQDTGGRFEEERPTQDTPPKKNQIFRGQPGSAAPVLELSRIVDRVEQSPSFKNLPNEVQQGLLKIKKMTSNAFKYASDVEVSEKEAFFGGDRDSLKDLKNLLLKYDKTGPDPRKVPDEVTKAVDNLNIVLDSAIAARPKEKGVLEKGMDVARGVADKGKDVARGIADTGKSVLDKGQGLARGIAEKGQQIKKNFQDNQERKVNEQKATTERQQSALKALKDSLFNYKTYKDIYYRLPAQIIKTLESIGLGVEDLSNMATAKVACHVNNTMLHYLRTKEAYSPSVTNKEAMDFSGIGNLVTQKEKLNDREISRAIRLAIAAELDAVHLYELIVDSSDDETVKKVLQSISDEEKVHAGELEELLNRFDKESDKYLEDGRKEVQDLIKE